MHLSLLPSFIGSRQQHLLPARRCIGPFQGHVAASWALLLVPWAVAVWTRFLLTVMLVLVEIVVVCERSHG